MTPAQVYEATNRIEKWLRWHESHKAGIPTPGEVVALHYDDVKILHSVVLSRRVVGAAVHLEVVVRVADNLNDEGFNRVIDAIADADLDDEVACHVANQINKGLPRSLVEEGAFDVTVNDIPAS